MNLAAKFFISGQKNQELFVTFAEGPVVEVYWIEVSGDWSYEILEISKKNWGEKSLAKLLMSQILGKSIDMTIIRSDKRHQA